MTATSPSELERIGRAFGEQIAIVAIGAVDSGDLPDVNYLVARMSETVRGAETDMREEGFGAAEIEIHTNATIAGFRAKIASYRAGLSAAVGRKEN